MAKKKKETTDPVLRDIARVLEAVRKKHGQDSAVVLREGGYATVREVLPTGLAVLDRHVLGIGGLPWGRVVEVFGGEGGGKTTLLNKFIAAAQRDGHGAALRDAENKFDPGWARRHGVQDDKVVLLEAETLEDWFSEVETLMGAAKVRYLLALDSLAMLPTRAEHDAGLDKESRMAATAGAWSKNLKILSRWIADRQWMLVIINQLRQRPGVLYGNPDYSPGGNAVKHAATIRLTVSHGKSITTGSVKSGRYMKVTALKNQVAPPYRTGEFMLDYESGFDEPWSVLNHAKEVGCIQNTADRRHYPEALKNLGWEGGPTEVDRAIEVEADMIEEETTEARGPGRPAVRVEAPDGG